jgi:membrane-anchored protein YejM (alkaline phosphatase superfamily)
MLIVFSVVISTLSIVVLSGMKELFVEIGLQRCGMYLTWTLVMFISMMVANSSWKRRRIAMLILMLMIPMLLYMWLIRRERMKLLRKRLLRRQRA